MTVFALSLTGFASGAEVGEPSTSTTVGVDKRTGRLVRRVVVPSRVVQPVVVGARTFPAGIQQKKLVADEKIGGIIDEVSTEHKVDPLLVHAIIHVESRYNRLALSPKGAEGLMQLIPSTARQYGVKNSFDSRQNIEGGVRYLRKLQDQFSDLRHALAAYNAGENAVTRYHGIPPYAETQDYVYKVGKRYGDLRREHRQQTGGPAAKSEVADAVPAPPEYRPLESYIDQEGKLHLRTR